MVSKPRIIAVAGGSGSGKTTLVGRLMKALGERDILVLQLDHYYNDLSTLPMSERDRKNFDHPDAFDTKVLAAQLKALADGKTIDRPTYDFATHSRTKEVKKLNPEPVILLDGILALHWPEVRELLDLAIFVDVDDDVRIIRRLKRDVSERGRTIDSVITQYLATVKSMHDTYCAPQRDVADIVVRWMDYNDSAVAMIAAMIRSWQAPA